MASQPTFWFQGRSTGDKVVSGLTAEKYLELIAQDQKLEEEEKARLAQEAQLGPQVSAGVRAYETLRGRQSTAPMAPAAPDGEPVGVASRPSQRRFGTSGFDSIVNEAVQEQQTASAKPFMAESRGMVSQMEDTSYKGFTEPQMAKERQMSGPMLQLLEGVPPEMADDLIAQYRLQTIKPNEFVKQITAIKDSLRKEDTARKKEAFSSGLKVNEKAAEQAGTVAINEPLIQGREDVERMGNESAERIAAMNNAAKLELERMKQDKEKGGKTDKEVKGLMDLRSAFDQLENEHSKIWTGPVAGRIGRANVFGVERAKFNATRAQVLKTIAKAFEGARMSDIDMKFYERMIPQDSHTTDQFKGIRDSMMNLVDWRIKRFNETGSDPGAVPPETAEPSSTKSGPVSITSDEEYNALPSGTEFTGPDGIRRRKP